ncbi:oxidoreductase NAD-binding domain-containing protein 1 isoform X2, partial [Haematococcus lacustris]
MLNMALQSSGLVELAVKRSQHPVATWLHCQAAVGLAVGGSCYLEPHLLRVPTVRLLFIAGGIGITPLLSMMAHVTELCQTHLPPSAGSATDLTLAQSLPSPMPEGSLAAQSGGPGSPMAAQMDAVPHSDQAVGAGWVRSVPPPEHPLLAPSTASPAPGQQHEPGGLRDVRMMLMYSASGQDGFALLPQVLQLRARLPPGTLQLQLFQTGS